MVLASDRSLLAIEVSKKSSHLLDSPMGGEAAELAAVLERVVGCEVLARMRAVRVAVTLEHLALGIWRIIFWQCRLSPIIKLSKPISLYKHNKLEASVLCHVLLWLSLLALLVFFCCDLFCHECV